MPRFVRPLLVLSLATACSSIACGGSGDVDEARKAGVHFASGSAEARAIVLAEIATVPEVLSTASGPWPLRIEIGSSEDMIAAGDDALAFYLYYRAPFEEDSGEGEVLSLTTGILPGSPLSAERNKVFGQACMPGDILFDDDDGGLTAVLAHELTHRYDALHPGVLADFVALRFESLSLALEADTVFEELNGDYVSAAEELFEDPDDADLLEATCAASQAAWERYTSHGFPSRFTHDMHGRSDREYLAIAIELLLRDKATYCASYTAEERDFLLVTFGPELAAADCS